MMAQKVGDASADCGSTVGSCLDAVRQDCIAYISVKVLGFGLQVQPGLMLVRRSNQTHDVAVQN
jgi:hypothetical protein